MMRIEGPRRVRARKWIPVVIVVAATAYLAWPAADETELDVVEAIAPVRDGAPLEQAQDTQPGYAPRANREILSSNLFESHSWYVAPPPPPVLPSAPAAPVAPPLPFTLLGSYARAGDSAVFFLVKGDRIFDARVGDVLEKLYSVDSAEDGQLRLTYLPLGIKQSLAVKGDQ